MEKVKMHMGNKGVGLLLMRLALGIIFIAHGWMKVTALPGTVSFFASLGIPAFFAYLVSFIELLGGIAVILGIFTRISGALIACIMLYSILFVKWSAGLTGMPLSYELDLALLGLALGLAFSGPGKYSLTNAIKREGHGCEGKKCSGGMKK